MIKARLLESSAMILQNPDIPPFEKEATLDMMKEMLVIATGN
jgi:hypothetical protein